MRKLLPIFHNTLYTAFFSCIILLSFFAFLISANTVHAIETQRLGISPTHSTEADLRTKSWLIYTLPAGETRQDSVMVVNNSLEQITAKVYAVDSTKTNSDGFALKNENEKNTTVGAWVSIDTKEFTLAPKEKREISFTFHVPANTAVGEYSGGIVVQETIPQKVKRQGMDVNVISRVGVRIYETVPGTEKLNMMVRDLKYDVSNGHLNFSFVVENKSTVNLTPRGVFVVKDMFGRQLDMIALDKMIDTLVPNVPTTVSVPTKILPPLLGWNTAMVSVYYSPTKAAGTGITFMPNKVVPAALAFLILLAAGFVKFKKRIIKKTEKSGDVILAPQVKIVVAMILIGAVAFSALVAFLLNTYFGG